MTEAGSQRNQGSIAHLAGRYLTFALSEEKYGLQILKVQEIIGLMPVTRVPHAPDYLKGVINLRGRIIPVVDLRLKFRLPSIPYDEKTCIIVVHTQVHDQTVPIGIVVDTVLEVINFQPSQLEAAPEYGMSLATNFLLGMGRTQDNNVIILIDIEKALADANLSSAIPSEAVTPSASA